MNKSLALILMIAVSIPFVGCTDEPNTRNTVFHPTDENPRAGSPRKKSRYGHGGTHSPEDPRRTASRNIPTDPDGIVKPRDLDPDEGGSSDLASSDDPDNNPESTGGPTEADNDPTATASAGGDPPYAEPVPGKYGLVYSPFVKDKKNALVNVTDDNGVPFPPGTEVVDPHTQKVFRVP